jgi:hypothetical protein
VASEQNPAVLGSLGFPGQMSAHPLNTKEKSGCRIAVFLSDRAFSILWREQNTWILEILRLVVYAPMRPPYALLPLHPPTHTHTHTQDGMSEQTEPARVVKGLHRETGETSVRVDLNLDGTGVADVKTGIGFLGRAGLCAARTSVRDTWGFALVVKLFRVRRVIRGCVCFAVVSRMQSRSVSGNQPLGDAKLMWVR